jgi:hypothetical protein
MSQFTKHLPILAAASLASLSLSDGAELRALAQSAHPEARFDTSKDYQKLGSFKGTSFYLQTEGIRKYLVAVNQGDVSRILCQSTALGGFSVTDFSGAVGLCRISLGADQYAYTPFAGGLFGEL